MLKNNHKVQLFPVIALLMIFGMNGCSTAEQLSKEESVKVSRAQIFSPGFTSEVYRSNMVVYGNELSGMTIIKKTGESYRVVFVSEIGLKYFDMEFFIATSEVKVHHMTSLLDKKPVVEKLTANYELVFMLFPEKARQRYFRDSGVNSMILEVKSPRRKSYYTYDRSFGWVGSIRYKNRSRIIAISLSDYDHASPGKLNFNQSNFSLHLEKIETQD